MGMAEVWVVVVLVLLAGALKSGYETGRKSTRDRPLTKEELRRSRWGTWAD